MTAGSLKKAKVAVLASFSFILILIVFLSIRVYSVDKIHTGVRSFGVTLSGLSRDEAAQHLEEYHQQNGGGVLELIFDSQTKTINIDELAISYHFDMTAEQAMKVGREGNFFSKNMDVLAALFGRRNIGAQINYDETVLTGKILEIVEDIGEKVQEYSYEFLDDKLLVTTGTTGMMPEESYIAETVLDAVRNYDFERPLVFEKKERKPENIDVDKLYEQVFSTPQNAKYEVVRNKVSISPHVPGRDFDKKVAEGLIRANRGYGVTFEIPLILTMPDVLASDLEGKIFTHKLGQYTTRYDASNSGRSNNVSLSANRINGTVLAPGDVFSYNDVVGERTYDEGFSTAKVYVNGEVVDGVGGGICQVSSTLYCAVLYADLGITQRVNHQLTVGYVPLGQDATVAYGSIDFRFKNSTDYPIKIVTTAKSGVMHSEIWGYKTDPSLEVSIENITRQIISPTVKEIPDPTMPLGERKVVTKGSNGAVVDSYKIVKKAGQEPVKTMISKSTYSAGMEVVHVGTGPEPTPEHVPATPPLGQPASGGVTTPMPSAVPHSPSPEQTAAATPQHTPPPAAPRNLNEE